MSLVDQIVLVTGAGSGIGRATAQRLARAGATVALVDVNPDAAAVVDEITADGARAEFFRADVADPTQVEDAVAEVVDRFGKLNGAFNNAGIEQSNRLLHELSPAQWERAISVDLTGVFNCLKYEIGAMLQSGGGSIVNTASSLGKVAIPNASEYVAAKHGVIGLTLAAAADYGQRGIRINAVLPGIINTAMVARVSSDERFSGHFDKLRERHVLGRFGEPDEIAASVEWLLSDAASFVTGATLAVDGGFLSA